LASAESVPGESEEEEAEDEEDEEEEGEEDEEEDEVPPLAPEELETLVTPPVGMDPPVDPGCIAPPFEEGWEEEGELVAPPEDDGPLGSVFTGDVSETLRVGPICRT